MALVYARPFTSSDRSGGNENRWMKASWKNTNASPHTLPHAREITNASLGTLPHAKVPQLGSFLSPSRSLAPSSLSHLPPEPIISLLSRSSPLDLAPVPRRFLSTWSRLSPILSSATTADFSSASCDCSLSLSLPSRISRPHIQLARSLLYIQRQCPPPAFNYTSHCLSLPLSIRPTHILHIPCQLLVKELRLLALWPIASLTRPVTASSTSVVPLSLSPSLPPSLSHLSQASLSSPTVSLLSLFLSFLSPSLSPSLIRPDRIFFEVSSSLIPPSSIMLDHRTTM